MRARQSLTAAALLWFCIGLPIAAAQTPPDRNATLSDLRAQIDAVQASLQGGTHGDDDLRAAGSRAVDALVRATDVADSVAPELVAVDARIAQLGVPAPPAVEDPDVVLERLSLAKKRMTLDGQARLARLLVLEGEQLSAQARGLRRTEFEARLGERTRSILSASFWADLSADLPRDLRRLDALGRMFLSTARSTPTAVWISVAALLIAALALLRWLHGRAFDWIASRSPQGRLRKSLHAVLLIASAASFAALCAVSLATAMDWRGTLPADGRMFLDKLAMTLCFGGYMYGLGTALICAKRPSWRLPPLPDAVASRIRGYPLQITLVSLGAWLAEQLVALDNASLAMTVAVDCLVALAMSLTLTLTLMRAENSWRKVLATDGTQVRPLWSKPAAALNWLILAAAVISLLTGYVAIGSFVVKQMVWATIVLTSAYLLSVLIDDLLSTWLALAPADTPKDKASLAEPAPALPSQIAVLVSGALRLAVMVVALLLIAAPFGEGPADLLTRRDSWSSSISFGQYKVLPVVLLQAAIVLAIGLAVVRVLRAWLSKRYLPSTSLAPDAIRSATALFFYAGIVITVALAMSTLGIGLERIAWVASALSVGIGFGLQAVVQDFVSGLILLTERPVKVGDWVSLDGVEGDIRHINVRATEIQMDDYSTLIVPNSKFITRVVRNRSLTNPFGVVVVRVPVPLDSDADHIRDILLETLVANTDVFKSPPPVVILESVGDGVLTFNATCYVKSPRMVIAARSALLFDALNRLRQAGIHLCGPTPPPAVQGSLHRLTQ